MPADSPLVLRLPYREPYDFAALLDFFARRAIPGIEQVDAQQYRRRFAIDGVPGTLQVNALPGEAALALTIDCPQPAALPDTSARVRRMFDLDADIGAINAHLGAQAPLRALIRRHPGQRLPGGWDGFEIAVRAVLGQQISVAAARTLAARLVTHFGERIGEGAEGFTAFPNAAALVDADLGRIGVTRQRASTLRALARAVCDGRVDFRPEQTLARFVASWTELPGIGAWTAHYIAMRALGDADAFPAADLVLRKAVADGGAPVSARALEALAQAWRPWRAYAVLHLWRSM